MKGAFRALIVIVLTVVAFFLGCSKNPQSTETPEAKPHPKVIEAKKAFTVCPENTNGPNGKTHPMGPVCRGQNGKLCELDLDSFRQPMGGAAHDSDAACAIWPSYLGGSQIMVSDKGANPLPFTITFSAMDLTGPSDPCGQINAYNDPFANQPNFSSGPIHGGYGVTMGPLLASAVNCHFKMTLTRQNNEKYDPHIDGTM